jgi:hypothetical protein
MRQGKPSSIILWLAIITILFTFTDLVGHGFGIWRDCQLMRLIEAPPKMKDDGTAERLKDDRKREIDRTVGASVIIVAQGCLIFLTIRMRRSNVV